MSQSSALARLIAQSAPDSDARRCAREGLRDLLAVTVPVLSGAITDPGLAALRRIWPGEDPQTQALLTGYSAHALDFDDFHADFRGHPGAVILPALFAAARTLPDITRERFLDALAIGVETAGRLGLAVGQGHYLRGFHNTGTLGTLAAAAAVARLAGLDENGVLTVLSLATSQAAGLRVQFGSTTKPLHAGLAARAAVTALQLAQAGIDAGTDGALEAFLQAYGDSHSSAEALTAGWGAPWRIVTPGLEAKAWPTCSGTHGAALAALRLREQWQSETGRPSDALAEDIETITVAFPPGGDVATSVYQPRTGIEARFSLEYVIAHSLLHGEPRIADFSTLPLNPQTSALAERVVRTPDPTAPPDALNPSARFHTLTLFLRDGSTRSQRVTRQQTLAHGVDMDAKLRQCLATLNAPEQARWLRLSQLEDNAALDELLEALRLR